MGKILALAGKKQSGKNTSANFLLGLKMIEQGIIHRMDITPKGELQIYDIWGDTSFEGAFQYFTSNPTAIDFIEENIHPWFKIYSFADLLKRSVCIELLGLSEEQCFGTDAQKNTLTHLYWENMPGVITKKPIDLAWSLTEGHTEQKWEVDMLKGRLGEYYEKLNGALVYHAPGRMTAREVMQFAGTEIFRKMYHDVWAEGTVKRILKEGTELAVICDCRFPNEVEAVQRAGGKVIRFTRCQPIPDNHPSETSLDDYVGFDAVIDNKNMQIGEQNSHVYDLLKKWNFPILDLEG